MAWKKIDDDSVAPVGKMFTYRDKKYPPTWQSWSDDFKTEMGLRWVDDPQVISFDNKFYKGVDSDNKLIEKDLKELKLVWIEKNKNMCDIMLRPTDWYCIRKADIGTAIPANIIKYRADVRSAYVTVEGKITACSNLTEFKVLFDIPLDEEGEPTAENPPMYNFPKLEDY